MTLEESAAECTRIGAERQALQDWLLACIKEDNLIYDRASGRLVPMVGTPERVKKADGNWHKYLVQNAEIGERQNAALQRYAAIKYSLGGW
jgi:hypothetical protein